MTYLTAVTLEVEVFVEGHHSDSFLAARGRNDGFITAHTQRRETSGRKRQRGYSVFLMDSHKVIHYIYKKNKYKQIKYCF